MRNLPQAILQIAVGTGLVLAILWTWFHPGRFSNIQLLGGILFVELLFVFVWHYERYFFAVVMISFLWAGTMLPLQDGFNIVRWILLGIGAVVGCIIWMKSSFRSFSPFHMIAAFCVLSAAASSVVSAYPGISLAKTGSLFLLFLYGSSGLRLAVHGREERFFQKLLLVLEILVYLSALAYFVFGIRLYGNPNSLGAIMGIGVFPVLLWAFLVGQKTVRVRRGVALLVCVGLLLFSVTRAAMLASAVVGLVLCLSLREYKLLFKTGIGFVCILSLVAILAPSYFEQKTVEFKNDVFYKGHIDQGVLGSRQSPWDRAATEIRDHPFFGSGFGTSPTGEDPGLVLGRFHSTSELSREHGSSYLAISEWVGLLGLLPFIALFVALGVNTWKTCAWMMNSRNARHYSIPLAMVVIAGLVHAGFEDWLFAVGSYLSVYFWCLAFILADLVPQRTAVHSVAAAQAVPTWPYPLQAAASKR